MSTLLVLYNQLVNCHNYNAAYSEVQPQQKPHKYHSY